MYIILPAWFLPSVHEGSLSTGNTTLYQQTEHLLQKGLKTWLNFCCCWSESTFMNPHPNFTKWQSMGNQAHLVQKAKQQRYPAQRNRKGMSVIITSYLMYYVLLLQPCFHMHWMHATVIVNCCMHSVHVETGWSRRTQYNMSIDQPRTSLRKKKCTLSIKSARRIKSSLSGLPKDRDGHRSHAVFNAIRSLILWINIQSHFTCTCSIWRLHARTAQHLNRNFSRYMFCVWSHKRLCISEKEQAIGL